MKFLSIAAGVLSLCLCSVAQAIPITKVLTFDRVIERGEEFHFIIVDLAEYGFVSGVDKVTDWVGPYDKITFEFRDIDDEPDNPYGSAFLWIFMDQGRQFGRVGEEDWEGPAAFNRTGRLIPYVTVNDERAWLGDVTVTFDLLQNKNVDVSEPLPLALMSLGLLAIGMRRYNIKFTKSKTDNSLNDQRTGTPQKE